MKVILYLDITANGMIGKPDGNSDFTSEDDGKSFTEICQKAGVIISGRKTYDVLYPDFMPLKTGTHYVLSRDLSRKSDNLTVKFTSKQPKELIEEIRKSGQEIVVVIGGQNTISQFMKENLIDEVFLDIEPLFLGQGMSLFKPSDFEIHLELLETKNLSPQTLQLHYKILRH